MTRSQRSWAAYLATRLAGVAADAAVLAAAYWGAILLRFDFQSPSWGWRGVALSFVTVAAAHFLALAACGCYRGSWRRFSTRDLPRCVLATAAAAAVLTALRFLLSLEEFIHVRPPYSVTLITFALATIGLAGWRIVWSWRAHGGPADDAALIGRKARRIDSSATAGFLRGKTVMVTGAGGSIGSELARQVAAAGPKALLLVERGENALYEIDRELRGAVRAGAAGCRAVPLMVDAGDCERMAEVFREFRPEVVLHAAAYKHVPMVEANPREGERNNVGATRCVAELSKEFGVARFVLISTDKAVNPTSVMGRTKRAAEKAVLALNSPGGTSFCAVRFGNVLGSSGSVVPLFREQISRGVPVTVTHPEMKRYFMTVREAVGLVLQAASRSEQAIYTLDMGEPVLVLDLAERMIRRAGLFPYVDVPIEFTGIRPGEKLFEELDISEKSAYRTDMARIYVTREDSR